MRYVVAAVQEAMGLLMLVANNPGFGVTELAKRSGNTKARAYRLLVTLEACGFVKQAREDASYSLGHTAVALGLAAQQQVDVVKTANEHLSRLGQAFNENVALQLRDGIECVCVALWQSSHNLRVHAEIGRRRPLYAGASGKVLLAFADDEIQKAVVSAPLTRFTPNTIVSKPRLSKELIRIRSAGFAVSHSELMNDVVAIAAPVFDSSGEAIATLGMRIPSSRVPASIDKHVAAVVATAARISSELGWRDHRIAEAKQHQMT